MMSEKETYEICNEVDSFIARELTESIIHKVSYDMLEAHYGILPISRRSFLICKVLSMNGIKAF